MGYRPVIIDKEAEPASGASGKAGGFLARKWNDKSPTGPLTRRSYDLHEEHGKLFDDTLYRSMDTWSASVHPPGPKKEFQAENLKWLDSTSVSGLSHLSGETDTAQVHPLHYTRALFRESVRSGAQFEQGEIIDLALSDDASCPPISLTLLNHTGESRFVTGDLLVVCLGSWSDVIFRKVLQTPDLMGAICASSVVFRPSGPVPNVALFTDWYTPGNPNSFDPEVYPRPDNTLYICACASVVDVPEGGTASVTPETSVTDRIEAFAAQLSPFLADSTVLTRQACILPTTPDDTPIIGEIVDGRIFAATGHSCWGILNAPATGEAMAQLIHLGKSQIDLSPFDPVRFKSQEISTGQSE
jgi:glycine/D-amino acid oxidase-like deaminating enzyme